MQTILSLLQPLKAALGALTDQCYHYVAEPNAVPPYLVWAEDSDVDLCADGEHAERAVEGTIDLYTKTEGDPLLASVEAALEALGASWYLNSFQYETETGLLHCEWVFGVI